jgi:hypothetical protein
MKKAINSVTLVGAMFVFLSSCAAPQPVKPTAKPVAKPIEKPAEKPTLALIDKTFEELAATESEKKKTDMDHVKNVVNMRQVQLRNLYKQEKISNPSQGTLLIKLNISDKGTVPNPEVRQELTGWRFMVRSPLTYAFKIELK